ncbi:ATP-binding protein [Leptotrichia sp. oral taxon 417]|jgi:ABC transporter, ATP-binding protein|uniref:AAA family ATPase n=1 Tax=Leptotrichia sp. oral taxon 417 TaxID=712365 RepID=UPI0015B861E9|nr:AAA family ATPase [Leptotrichia sp. oral taxon 417]NWO27890.1 ATP-binding protein [Leptotrichia sp. oral taxon 417]
MKLSIRNVGKLKEADVEINGITVIAGENNTGKSTIGKVLFSIFQSLYKLDDQIIREKRNTIKHNLELLYVHATGSFFYNVEFKEIIDEILIEGSKYDIEILKNKILEFISNNSEKTKNEIPEEPVKRIFDLLKIPKKSFVLAILNRNFSNEFNNQITNIYTELVGNIKLKIQDKESFLSIENNIIKEIKNEHFLNTEIVYIDDPFILDDLTDELFVRNAIKNTDYNTIYNHKNYLKYKLIQKKGSLVDEIILNSKLEKFYLKLNELFEGDIILSNRGNYVYRRKNKGNELNLINLSAGLKSFAVLKMLFINNTLQENGTIILDEPEIHLHPEWQIKFAELIVLLQKEFKMHILLTTHSPYFLKAIQVYSKKYKISNKCKYYMSELDGEQAILVDKTNKTDDLFYKLAISFENLMNEEELYED